MSTRRGGPPSAPGLTPQNLPSAVSPFAVKQEPQALSLFVKSEPIEQPLSGAFPQSTSRPLDGSRQQVGSSFQSVTYDGQTTLPFERKNLSQPSQPILKIYNDALDIVYTPEAALQQGLAMVNLAKKSVSTLHVGSKMRQEVWLRDIKRMEDTGAHKTMIALCGATGAGKSSVINALLDDTIVPTSGMRACTATVTEISYHNRRTIDADIDFLTRDQWKTELEVLLQDLQDDDGHLKRLSDMRNDAGVAWHKVHAVYPKLTGEQLIRMSADQIIASEPKIARILDTTKRLCCQNSREFGKEINKYIDSKDQKRGDKKDKQLKKKKKKNAVEEPAFWPLIRQVKIRIKAEALSTGAVLCDLPGVADANAARSSIAKDYMKLANCIWVLAPIHRAVDDKTARDLLGDAFKTQLLMDGSYDDSTVTFVATKADDIAASEIVNALQLQDEPELEEFEEEIDRLTSEGKAAKKDKQRLIKEIEAADKQLQRHKSILAELQEHIHCVRVEKKFIPRLTAKQKRAYGDNPRKRKSMNSGRKTNLKRRKSDPDDEESEDESDEDSDSNLSDSVPGEGSFIATSECESDELDSDQALSSSSEELPSKKKANRSKPTKNSKSKSKRKRSRKSDSSSESSESSESEDSDESDSEDSHSHKKKTKKKSNNKRNRSHHDSDDEDNHSDLESADEEGDEETEESLESKILAKTTEIKELRAKISELKQDKSEAGENLTRAKNDLESAQRQKNAWCALKRADFSRDVLKQDFRTGLRELDEAAAIERDAASFDPSEVLRDYDAIDLPVFCVSARDYARIHKLNKGDGGPATFTDDEQTEVPELRKWCKQLTVATRERTAKVFLETIRVFAMSILSYVDGLEGISEVEREAMRRKWQTPQEDDDSDEEEEAYAWIGRPWNEDGLLDKRAKSPPRDARGNLIGIMPRLRSEFQVLADETRDHLMEKFKDGLENKCDEGAEIAAKSALEISDKFAQEIHWQTYRATLRREGEFRSDLNEQLCNPLTKNIASSWAQVFEANLFSALDGKALSTIQKILREVEDSTRNPGLKERCKLQAELAIEEAKVELSKLVTVVSESLQNQQKDISRCIAPTVRAALKPGYFDAAMERGRGSVARQKAIFRKFLDDVRGKAFEGSTSKIFDMLDTATDDIADQLENALEELAKKMEVNLSVLWEGAKDTPEQQLARAETKKFMKELIGQVDLWRTAAAIHEMV